MNKQTLPYRDIPISTSLQNLAMDELLPDGLYLTRIDSTVRKVLVVNGIVSLYGDSTDRFVNRFSQSHFFEVNVVISRLNNKKWKQKSRLLEAGKMIKERYSSKK